MHKGLVVSSVLMASALIASTSIALLKPLQDSLTADNVAAVFSSGTGPRFKAGTLDIAERHQRPPRTESEQQATRLGAAAALVALCNRHTLDVKSARAAVARQVPWWNIFDKAPAYFDKAFQQQLKLGLKEVSCNSALVDHLAYEIRQTGGSLQRSG